VRIVGDLPHQVREIENAWVPVPGTRDRMAARMFLPEGASAHHPVPAILEYLPYRKREFTAIRDTPMHRYFAGNGYASVRVDMRGSGDSDGVMTDEYLPQELDEGKAAIAWLADQPWCDGNVGMIGNSWGGFNALQVAALRPPALNAIVTSCSTDDRYADDMHYMGGALLTDTLDWGATFYTLLGRPPDPPIVGDRWHAMWGERMESLNFMVEDWLRHQRRDAFWKHGSVNEDYAAIQCPVFAVGGYLDGYSNAVFRLLAGLSVPRMGLVGPWAHAFPHLGVPNPQFNFLAECVRWFDRWLKGEQNGVDAEPMLRTFMPDGLPPKAFYADLAGRWVAEDQWPSPRIAGRRWRLGADGRLTADGAIGADGADGPDTSDHAVLESSSPQLTGLVGGEWCPYGTGGKGPEFPGDQREDDGRSLTFTSAPLSERLEILGAPVVELDLAVDRPTAFVAVRLCDVAPDGASTRATYGILNLAHRTSHEDLVPMTSGRRGHIRVQLNDTAYAFRAGHRLRVSVSTTYWPMVWPSPEIVTLSVWPAGSSVTLPVRPPRPEDARLVVDTDPETGPPADTTQVRPGRWERSIHTDVLTGETVVTNIADPGTVRLNNLDLEFRMAGEDRVGIREGDPLSCWAESLRTSEQRRGDWNIRLEGRIRLTSTASDFQLTGDFEGFESDRSVFTQHREATIPRDNV
jgi:putative CocE/NonD family hydrolase